MGLRRISVVLTRACNLRCSYCSIRRSPPRVLGWEPLRASLDALLPRCDDRFEVTFTGGEPLTAFDVLKKAVLHVGRKVDSRRVGWRVLTNGLLLGPEALAFLDDHAFIVNLSCDGLPAAQEQRGAGTRPALAAIFNCLREGHPKLFRERLKVCVTLTPDTIQYLADSVRDFLKREIRTFAISPATGPIAWSRPRIDELRRAFDAIAELLWLQYQRSGEVPLLLFRKSVTDDALKAPRWRCRVDEGGTSAIDADGREYACLAATATYVRSPVGPDRQSIVRDPVRCYSSYGRCADCEFLGRCQLCPLASGVEGSPDPFRVSDFLCAFNQVALAARDRFPPQPTADDYFSGRVPLSALRFADQRRQP